MTLGDIAVGNLRRRKGKAFFVLAGLLIGVSTVVALLSLVAAMRQDINHKLEMYGANILIVPKTENLSLTYGGFSLGGVSFEMQEIREEELENIKKIANANNVAAVNSMLIPIATRIMVFVSGKKFQTYVKPMPASVSKMVCKIMTDTAIDPSTKNTERRRYTRLGLASPFVAAG